MAKTALLFAGQGAQVVGMGRDLADAHSTAKLLFAEADEALGPAAGAAGPVAKRFRLREKSKRDKVRPRSVTMEEDEVEAEESEEENKNKKRNEEMKVVDEDEK